MESILNKKIIGISLCFTIFFSNFVLVSEVYGQNNNPSQPDTPFQESGIPYFFDPDDGILPDSDTSTNRTGWNGLPGVLPDLNPGTGTPTLLPMIPFDEDDNIFGSPDDAGLAEKSGIPTFRTQYDASLGQSGTKSSVSENGTATEFASCALGAQLGSQISDAIRAGANSVLADIGKRFAESELSSVAKVPVFDAAIQQELIATDKKIAALKSKEVSIGSFFGISLPSLDAIGYCLINTLIVHISESTIRWINSGFQGNPAFIENYEQFFSDLADREITVFLGEIANTDLICGPLRIDVQRSLIQSHNSRYFLGASNGVATGSGKCTFGRQGTSSFEVDQVKYNSGDPTEVVKGGWGAFAQVFEPQNNFIGATIEAKVEARRRVASRASLTMKETEINNGVLSAKDENGNVITPGSIIQSQAQKRLEIPDDRLVLADEFDEIVTVLVNKLIKIALNETIGKLNTNLKNQGTTLEFIR